MKQLPLTGANSVQGHSNPINQTACLRLHTDVVTLVRQYIEAHPDIRDDRSRWVEGMGWDQTKWPGQVFPTAVCAIHRTLLVASSH